MVNGVQKVVQDVVPQVNQVTRQVSGFWQTVKAKIDVLAAKMNLSSETLTQIGAYLGIGFFTGFLFKKYFSFIFMVFLAAVLTIWGLEYFNLINVNWLGLKTICGLQQTATVDTVMNACFSWVRTHWIVVLSGLVGFIIGYKVG